MTKRHGTSRGRMASTQQSLTLRALIDHSIELIRENPRIGKPLTVHFLHRHQHTTSRGWEIIYDDDLQNSRVIIIDIQRGFNEDRHQRG